jgi:hypothetical protein
VAWGVGGIISLDLSPCPVADGGNKDGTHYAIHWCAAVLHNGRFDGKQCVNDRVVHYVGCWIEPDANKRRALVAQTDALDTMLTHAHDGFLRLSWAAGGALRLSRY